MKLQHSLFGRRDEVVGKMRASCSVLLLMRCCLLSCLSFYYLWMVFQDRGGRSYKSGRGWGGRMREGRTSCFGYSFDGHTWISFLFFCLFYFRSFLPNAWPYVIFFSHSFFLVISLFLSSSLFLISSFLWISFPSPIFCLSTTRVDPLTLLIFLRFFPVSNKQTT